MRQSPEGKGEWGDIKITEENIIESDLLLVFNASKNKIEIKTKESWIFIQEPPIPAFHWHKKTFKFHDRIFSFDNQPNLTNIQEQTCLPWHINKTYDQLKNLESSDLTKEDKISCIISNKAFFPGHNTRLNFIQHLQEKDFKFNLFGKGINPIDDKFDGLAPFKYSIAIENHACNHYWTEKIADCFLTWTMPIYYGAPNIFDYFPRESIIYIDPADPDLSMKTIQKAVEGDSWGKNLEAIAQARDLILNQYQLFPSLAAKIRKYGLHGRRKWKYIPQNTGNYFPPKREIMFNIGKTKARNIFH